MNSRKLPVIVIGVIFITSNIFGLSFKTSDGRWDRDASSERSIQSIESLIVGNYNVENLFQQAVVPPQDGLLNLFSVLDSGNPIKPVAKIKEVARAILTNNYDIFVVEEVENLQTLELLNKYYLNNLYKPFLIEGNDPRGIDVGFFVKKDLPYFIEERSNKDEMWEDPTHEEEEDLLFSRDLPELHIRLSAEADPAFVLMGTHYKSKIGRKDDPESKILRKAQVERTAEIFKRLSKEFGKSLPLFIAGDFNGEVSHEPEFAAFRRTVKLFDAFDYVSPAVNKKERFTHVYFPKSKPMELSQLDGFMFDYHATKAIRRAFPFRYTDMNGNVLPIPKTVEEKNKNPSDHYPVVVELDPSKFVD